MASVNEVLAMNILKYRKKKGFTQEELAEKLGVTFQAVSKWENGKSAPDITFLPMMADIFDISIDEMFSRRQTIQHDVPWKDDDVIRGVIFAGNRILQTTEMIEKFTFEFVGEASGGVECECNLTVKGNVSGGCSAGNDAFVEEGVSGGCIAGNNISVKGEISGGCNAGGQVNCSGDITGEVSAGDSVLVKGNVKSKKITGNVSCKVLGCEKIEGSVVDRIS